MTPQEVKELVQTLRECGVTHYKQGDIELDLDPVRFTHEKPVVSSEEDKKIPHVVKQLSSLLKLDDRELIDQLFPTENTEEVA